MSKRTKTRLVTTATLQLKAYDILAEKIEDGIAAGLRHYDKHRDRPLEELGVDTFELSARVYTDIMAAIGEVLE